MLKPTEPQMIHDILTAMFTGKPIKEVWCCPYCGKDKPSGAEPTNWACCGEAGHAEKQP